MIADNSSSKKHTNDQRTTKTIKGKKEKERTSKYDKSHMIIPIEDMDWALTQSPTVHRLWSECWKSDPYGSRYMPLNTSLKGDNLRKAKKVLKDSGLFNFEVKMIVIGTKKDYENYVINYHGCRSSYWGLQDRTENPEIRTENPEIRTENPEIRTENPGVQPETLTQKSSPDPSVTSHKHLSNSSKEVLRCAELSAAKKSGTNSADENLITHPVTPLNTLEEKLGNGTSPGEVMGLEAHFEAAKEGIMPPQEVMEELRNSKYWTAYVAIALAKGWNIGRPEQTMTLEAKQMMETLKAKKNKPWL